MILEKGSYCKLLVALTTVSLSTLLGAATFSSGKERKPSAAVSPKPAKKKLLFSDDFQILDTLKWRPEIEPKPNSTVYAKQGKLVLDTQGGVTVWLKQPLHGNIQIEYTRKIPVAGNPNDRLSDLNQFWMASEPTSDGTALVTRSGKLEGYDNLRLYYVGMGGNTNTTTRFRKYQGNGERTLLQEYSDPAHLLQPNKEYKIKTIVQNGTTSFWVDGTCFFTYTDPTPFKTGYFGIRSTKSRQEIANFRVYQLN
ncbi:DUF6250 domain-containing protein [Hymenobacter sp. GOD-10R]|uniref:DUF6250 domain-containing protein n=1 Tax=Hymenobacter sp. GOD-10R TaxID=3093922 RepID=UPI002D76C173|nr:DUF6250 domain-containing protein [Hymenobacter sp. GOD-10R]WRQ26630.1 DUF6250 domain-containing protein [Hymenobacter sp. GOD-10R]